MLHSSQREPEDDDAVREFGVDKSSRMASR